MRLPEAVNIGVQSLGRKNLNEPLMIAESEGAIRRANQNILSSAADAAHRIYKLQKDAEKENISARDVLRDQSAIAEDTGFLLNRDNVVVGDKANGERINKWLEQQDLTDMLEEDGKTIKAFKIQQQYTKQLTDTILDEGEDRFETQEAKDKYVAQMSGIVLNSISKTKVDGEMRYQKHNQAIMQSNVNSYIAQGDELGAIGVLTQAQQNGTITPDELKTHAAAVRPAINTMQAEQRMAAASTQSELDDAFEFMEQNPPSFEARKKLVIEMQKKEERLFKMRGRQQQVLYADDVSQLAAGTLSVKMVEQQAADFKLTGSQAKSLISSLREGPSLESEPVVREELLSLATKVRYHDPNLPFSVEQRVNMVRDRIMEAHTGVTKNGARVEKTLNSDDFLYVTNILDQQEQKVRGQGQKKYQNALSQLKSFTGYAEEKGYSWEDSFQGRAYSDAVRSLNSYMEFYGDDPEGWVNKNKAKYDPNAYEKDSLEWFRRQHPRFADYVKIGEATKDTSGFTVRGQDSMIDPYRMLNRARSLMGQGILTEEYYQTLESDLQPYLYNLRDQSRGDN